MEGVSLQDVYNFICNVIVWRELFWFFFFINVIVLISFICILNEKEVEQFMVIFMMVNINRFIFIVFSNVMKCF